MTVKKKPLIFVFLLIVVLLLVFIFLITNRMRQRPTGSVSLAEPGVMSGEIQRDQEISLVKSGEKETSSLSDLIKGDNGLAGGRKCSWTKEIGEDVIAGLMLVLEDKFYSKTRIGKRESETSRVYYSLKDDQWLYSWSGGGGQGVKVLLSSLQSNNPQAKVYLDALNQKREIECEAWDGDVSYFVPQKDIEFKEVILEDVETGSKPASDYCQSCEVLEGEDKAMCLMSCQ